MLTRRDTTLLLLLTLFWGVNWPVLKFAVHTYPALTFRAISMLGGVLTLAVYLLWRRQTLALPRALWWPVTRLAIPNMVIWHFFAIEAVRYLSAGRSAILGYTMPIWALLISRFMYGERSSRWLIIGVSLAIVGTLLLLGAEVSTLAGQPVGVVLMLIAAIGWGLGTVWMRRSSIELNTTTLTFWMLNLTCVAMLVAAALTESAQWRLPNTGETLSIIYNAIIVFGFCHIVWFDLARKLPPLASSLSIMAIPAVGVFVGAWALHEALTWQDWVALLMTMAAVACVLVARPTEAGSTTDKLNPQQV